jgi:hypothetical protein
VENFERTFNAGEEHHYWWNICFFLVVFGGTETFSVFILLCCPLADSLLWSTIPDDRPI